MSEKNRNAAPRRGDEIWPLAWVYGTRVSRHESAPYENKLAFATFHSFFTCILMI